MAEFLYALNGFFTKKQYILRPQGHIHVTFAHALAGRGQKGLSNSEVRPKKSRCPVMHVNSRALVKRADTMLSMYYARFSTQEGRHLL